MAEKTEVAKASFKWCHLLKFKLILLTWIKAEIEEAFFRHVVILCHQNVNTSLLPVKFPGKAR